MDEKQTHQGLDVGDRQWVKTLVSLSDGQYVRRDGVVRTPVSLFNHHHLYALLDILFEAS
jgi:hypothetical protein